MKTKIIIFAICAVVTISFGFVTVKTDPSRSTLSREHIQKPSIKDVHIGLLSEDKL